MLTKLSDASLVCLNASKKNWCREPAEPGSIDPFRTRPRSNFNCSSTSVAVARTSSRLVLVSPRNITGWSRGYVFNNSCTSWRCTRFKSVSGNTSQWKKSVLFHCALCGALGKKRFPFFFISISISDKLDIWDIDRCRINNNIYINIWFDIYDVSRRRSRSNKRDIVIVTGTISLILDIYYDIYLYWDIN